MSEKVTFEGNLIGISTGDEHLELWFDKPPTRVGAPRPGPVRVTIERLPEPSFEDRARAFVEQLRQENEAWVKRATSDEPRCPHCGGKLEWGAIWGCPSLQYVRCGDCDMTGFGGTDQDALDALKAWRPPAPKCPFCGGEVAIVKSPRLPCRYFAACDTCAACGEGGTSSAALDDLAEWLDTCPRCGGNAEYRESHHPNGWWQAICVTAGCEIISPKFLARRAVAAWWNKRKGR